MALISCPECGKQISDTTPACPHCGYAFSSSATFTPNPTKIGEAKVSMGAGISLLVLGGICLLVSIFLTILFIPIGMICLVGSTGLIGMGYTRIRGMQDVYCPHCGTLGSMVKTEKNYKCQNCRKRSVRDGEYLKPV